MESIRTEFRERCGEIGKYLQAVRFIEEKGAEIISRDGTHRLLLDLTTRHVLKASVFLHLYNLVESTVTRCLHRVCEEIENSSVAYTDLADEWRRSWLQEIGKTNEPLNPESRWETLLSVCDHLVNGTVVNFRPSLSGGNLDDVSIERIAERHGVALILPDHIKRGVKRHVVDDNGPLELVRLRRNELAHGRASFRDCGRNVSVRDLRAWAAIVRRYLRVVISSFERYVTAVGFSRHTPS